MQRIAFFVYGLVCYAIFVATFAYTPGFLANLWVPKSIDSGTEGAWVGALLVNASLLLVFALLHSVMARPRFKAHWTRIVPPPIERSTYVLVSSLCMLLLFWQWRPLTGVVWEVENPLGHGVLLGLLGSGWLLVFYATCLIDHFDLFGMRQVLFHLRGEEHQNGSFATPALYSKVRHPIYLGWLIFFWATPLMTVGHLFFASVSTAYMLAAIPFEERDLVAEFGDAYRRYRASTPAIFPWPRRSEVTADFSEAGTEIR